MSGARGTDPADEEVVEDILTYWFSEQFWSKSEPKNPTAHYDELWRQRWFAKDDLTAGVDQHIRTLFGKHVANALRGAYNHWGDDHDSALAFVVLLDQFTRNIYRDTPKAWAGDPQALQMCLQAIEKGLDLKLKPIARAMLYMPLLHAESAAHQAKSVELYTALYENAKSSGSGATSILQRFHVISRQQQEAVNRFGRFPGRNKYLGRTSTVEENAYLDNSAE